MKGFLKYVLATVVGILLYSLVSSFIFLGVMGVIASASKSKSVEVKPNTILMLKLDKQIVDRSSENPFENFDFGTMQSETPIGLNNILKNIEKAKKDENIVGIYMDLKYIPAGLATLEEIRNSLIDFKESGKFIYTYSEIITQPSYYLASVSDSIFMNPIGDIEIRGFRSNIAFLKGALEKLGVEPVIFRHGKFKSAVEPFMYDKMSDDNKEQTMTFVGSIWDHVVKGISAEREISKEGINQLADNLTIRNSKSAVANNIIDGLFYKDEMIDFLVERTGAESAEKLEVVKLGKYNNVSIEKKRRKRDKREKIAIVYASGSIGMGKGEGGNIGSETTSKAIRKARKDSTIKAIVFRVNSPGGGVLASDIIWREVVLAQKAKPFIVSMGDYAASGGYYIACPADTIVASPTTLTGSIGVFALMMNTQKLMNDKLGITFDGVKTNKYADIGNSNRKMTEAEKEIIQSSVEDVYTDFITHVSEGRGITTEAVDAIGQGRIWSGINAKNNGLVDVYGGLNTAVRIAAEKAGLEDYKIVDLPKIPDPFEELIKGLTGGAKVALLKRELGESYRIYEKLETLQNMEGVQARMPFEVEIY